MPLLESIFLGMFLVGFLFTLITAIMSGALEHAFGEGSAFDAHAGEPGAMGGDVGPTAGEGTPEVGWLQHDLATFSPLSPTTISAFITAAGGMGYIALAWWEWSPWAAGALSASSGVVFAILLFLMFAYLFRATQGSSLQALDSIVGMEAEVTTAITSGGLGEVAYVKMGQRCVMSARAADAAAMPQGTKVVIKSVSPTILVVEETRESWLARTRAEQKSQAR